MSSQITTRTEVWYEIEFSIVGAADWFHEGRNFVSLEQAKQYAAQCSVDQRYEHRVIRKTVTEEPVQ